MSVRFLNDGIGAYNYISVEGDIPFTDEQLKEFELDWEHLTIWTLEQAGDLKIAAGTLFALASIILKRAHCISKHSKLH